MLDLKKIFAVLAGVMFLSVSAEARVCFLAGSGDDSGCLTLIGSYEPTSMCKGYISCAIPEAGASACVEDGIAFYRPENCCSDTTIYERCDGVGEVCRASGCIGSDKNGTYTACEIGYCECDSTYTEDCSGQGLKGVGESCGGLYQACQCSADYFVCDADATPGGSSCKDTTIKYASCSCPVPDGSNWTTDPDTCCSGFSKTCINQPSGKIVYKCNTSPSFDCVCGFSHAAGAKTTCINGCTDSNYEYVGNIPANVTCSDHTDGITGACGNDCRCNDGYWDFARTCAEQPEDVCEELGYTKVSCSGKWLGCPYDVSKKICIPSSSDGCTSGYAKTAADCGTHGAEGYELGAATDNVGCFKCVVKTCPTGTSTTLRPVSPQNEDGTTVQVIKAYSGDKACVQTDTCNLNYAYADKGCGTNMEMGTRKGKLLKGINGDRQCYECECKEGYVELPSLTIGKGKACVCATTCKDTATVPANATAVKSSCTACGMTTSIVTGFRCNSGYKKSGNTCVCATTCKDTATVPANATAIKSNCTACGVTTSIITGFRCNSGYTKSGNSCIKNSGGGGNPDPCAQKCQLPNQNSCACILCKNSNFCNMNPDNYCCQTKPGVDETDKPVTAYP